MESYQVLPFQDQLKERAEQQSKALFALNGSLEVVKIIAEGIQDRGYEDVTMILDELEHAALLLPVVAGVENGP